jgi:hypothetical protein
MILRDEFGQVIFCACSQLLNCNDPFEAEAKACEEGLRSSLLRSTQPIIVETDCTNLIKAASGGMQDRSLLMHLISEIRFLVNGEREFIFVKADRSQNRVSHRLANLARTDKLTMTWLGAGPECIIQELDQDLLVNHTT